MESTQLVKNLRFLMEKRMETANAVAVSCGVKASTMMRLLDGTSAAPRNSTLQALAMHFGVNPEKLLKSDLSIEVEELIEHKNVTEPISLLSEVEVYQIYCWNESDTTEPVSNDPYSLYRRLSNDRTWIPAPPDPELIDIIKQNSDSVISPIFAFTVKGDAMAPTFCEGDIVFVRYVPSETPLFAGSPEYDARQPENVRVKNGDYVLGYAYETQSDKKMRGRIIVRQYFEDDMSNKKCLLATNPNWPGERSHVCRAVLGKIVGRYTKFNTKF